MTKQYVRSLTCQESDTLLGRYEYPGWSVYSGCTDIDGAFGPPSITTCWEKDGVLIEDYVPWPRESGQCMHTEYRLVEEEA